MHAPLISTVTLFTEIIISAIVIYVIYKGYAKNIFPKKLAYFALIYETVFNITYMTTRVSSHAKAHEPAFIIILAIFHGVLSLLMFIGLVVFFITASMKYHKGVNFFKDHRNLTYFFTGFWFLSVLSGIVFYFVEYIM